METIISEDGRLTEDIRADNKAVSAASQLQRFIYRMREVSRAQHIHTHTDQTGSLQSVLHFTLILQGRMKETWDRNAEDHKRLQSDQMMVLPPE